MNKAEVVENGVRKTLALHGRRGRVDDFALNA
jgi:hypothetical protein